MVKIYNKINPFNFEEILRKKKWNTPLRLLTSAKRDPSSIIFISGLLDKNGYMWGRDATGKIRNIGRTASKRNGLDIELSTDKNVWPVFLGHPKPDGTIPLADQKRMGLLGMSPHSGRAMGRSELKDYLLSKAYNKIVRKHTGKNYNPEPQILYVTNNKVIYTRDGAPDGSNAIAWTYFDRPEIYMTDMLNPTRLLYAIKHESTHRSDLGLTDKNRYEYVDYPVSPDELEGALPEDITLSGRFYNPKTKLKEDIFNPRYISNPSVADWVKTYYGTPTEMRAKIIPAQIEMLNHGWSPHQAARLLPDKIYDFGNMKTLFTSNYLEYLLGNVFKKGGKLKWK